jgi:hypothetical protein
MTVIRTSRGVWTIKAVHVVRNGPIAIAARSAAGSTRLIFRKDVGRPRFDAAVAHWFASQDAPVTA